MAVEDTFVPVIKTEFDGIEVNISNYFQITKLIIFLFC